MAIYDDLFGVDSRGNMPAMDIGAALLSIYNANRLSGNASKSLEPTNWDSMYQQFANQLQQLTGQLADTNNPQFQSRVNQRMDEIMRSHTSALRQNQALQAARASRGLPGFINSERRDEGMSRNLAMLRQQAEAQARAEVARELAQAAQQTTLGSQVVGRGMEAERSRRVAQNNVQDYYNTAGQGSWMALAKAILPVAMKGMDIGKATDVSRALSRGYVSDAEQAASVGRPFTNPAQSWGANPQPMQLPALPNAVTTPEWDMLPQPGGVTIPDWDALPDAIPGVPQMDFTLPDVPEWDFNPIPFDWGTGFEWGNLDYGQFF